MKGIKYVAPIFDNSGYSSASREYILALHKFGIPITVKPFCFETNQKPFGDASKREIINSLVNKDIKYDIVISQLTPDMALKNREEGKHNIVYFAWETSRVHPEWVDCLNKLDSVFTCCDWNVESIKASGVVKPVYKVPHGIDLNKFDNIEKLDLGINIDEKTFIFYNIFQWNPRKNPEGLLRSYFNAFTRDENVLLVLKTYINNGCTNENKFISEQINKIKFDMGLSNYPRVALVTSILSEEQILGLHKSCDCLVSLHNAEGFGLVPFEAGLNGNIVIATGATGNMEYMSKFNSYPVDYRWGYVCGMSSFNRWYMGNGLWAEPSEVHASKLMRYVFENRDEARERCKNLQTYIKETFSWESVAKTMLDNLMR